MKFKKKSIREFIISIAIVLMMYMPGEINFLLGSSVIIFFLIKSRFVIRWVNIYSLFLMVLISTLNGMCFQQISSYRDIVRDLFYFVRGLTFICLGQEIFSKIDDISFLRIVLEAVFLKTILVFCGAIFNLGIILSQFNYLTIREFFSADNEGLAISLSILLTHKKDLCLLFQKRLLNLMVVLESMAFLLAFSRTGIVFLILMLLAIKLDYHKIKCKRKQMIKVIFVVAIFIAMLKLIPPTILTPFIEKIAYGFKEIGIHKRWSDTEIVQNWRGYEMFSALNLYENGSIYTKIFGYGFGKLIPVKFSELVGIAPELGGITILHNGYYMILIKNGIVGILLFLNFVFINIIYAIKAKVQYYSRILIGLTIAILFDTYVVTGMFKENSSIIMLLTLGFFTKMIFYCFGREYKQNENLEKSRLCEKSKKFKTNGK